MRHYSLSRVLKICFIAIYAALVYASQVILSELPNVEVVTLLIMIAAVTLPLDMSLLIVLVFVVLETLTYGFGDWSVLYLTIWPLFTLLCFVLRRMIKRWWFVAILVAGLFGYLFGSFDALTKLLLYGPNTMLAYWIRGFPFDLIHGSANIVIAATCYRPVSMLVYKYSERFFQKGFMAFRRRPTITPSGPQLPSTGQ